MSKQEMQEVLEGAATELAKKKIEAEPQRFGKIADPNTRLAVARNEVYEEYPELPEMHARLNAEK